jgi:hypothetical protein
MAGPEAKIEQYLKKAVENAGGVCIKIQSSSMKGVPDRLVVLNGMMLLVELKSDRGNLSKHQKIVYENVMSAGGMVFVMSDIETVDHLMAFLMDEQYSATDLMAAVPPMRLPEWWDS